MRFNRNIITAGDITNFKDPTRLVPTLDQAPPAGVHPVITDEHPQAQADAAQTVPGGVTVPSEDDYLTKLLKYVPAEILGFYLFTDSIIRSNTTGTGKAVWLGVAGVVALFFTAIYDRVTLEIVRSLQIAMSVVGLAVYIFTLGGWFATTTWYHPWYASLAVGAFAVIVGLIKLAPLPTVPNPHQSARDEAPALVDLNDDARQRDGQELHAEVQLPRSAEQPSDPTKPADILPQEIAIDDSTLN